MFTRQERQVILFLAALALLGITANFTAKQFSPAKTIPFLNPDITKIDLNSADRDALVSLPGIGQKLAGRIIEYRGRQGAFKVIEELKDIQGITNHRFEKIKDFVVISERKKSR